MPLFSKVKDIFQRGSSAKKKKVYHNVLLDNPEESWEIVGELGDGAYGKVYKAVNKDSKKLAALKLVPLEEEDDLDNFMIEIDILSECQHTNIVQLLEAYHYDGKLWMYLEYCDGGAVDSIMVDLDRPLSEKQIAYICKELLHALKYLHAQKIIHRDMKAGNVLLTMDGGVKLADFGVSAKNKHTLDKRGTFIGTPYWLAPEVILCETFLDAKYDYKADIWSLGITLIELAEMDPPNHEVSPVRVMLKIQKSDPPKLIRANRFSKNFNDFLTKCLVKDPNQRPSSQDLLAHPFISGELDKKPVIDLLLEYKAEVVEEDVDDESEDHDPSRHSIVTDMSSAGSHFDKSTLDSDIREVSESPPDEVIIPPNERRASKGPAPMPPASVPQAKKGPAPAVPDPIKQDHVPKDDTPKDVEKPTQSVTPPKTSRTPSPCSETQPEAESQLKSIESVKISPTQPETPPPQSPKVTAVVVSPELVSETPEEPVTIVTDGPVTISAVEPSAVSSTEIPSQSPESPVTIVTDGPVTVSAVEPSIVSSTDIQPQSADEPVSIVTDGQVTVSAVDASSSSADSTPHSPEPQAKTSVHLSSDMESSVVEITDDSCDVVASSGVVVVQTPSTEPAKSETVSCIVATGQDEVSTIEISSGKTSSVGSVNSCTSSISDEEANAVLILDSAIDSAIDNAIDEEANHQTKGSIVVVSPSPVSDEDKRSSRKLDESEVAICESSILQEDSTVPDLPKYDVTLEPDEPVLPNDKANISVVAVHQDDANEQDDVTKESNSPKEESQPLQPIANGVKRQNSKYSERSDTESSVSSDKENENKPVKDDVEMRRVNPYRKAEENARAQEKDKERQDFLALRRKTRKRTRRFEIDGVVVTTTTSKVIYGDDEEGPNASSHLARKQELREIKILQKQEQKQFQELSAKAEQVRLEQERKFESEKLSLLKNFDTQIELLNRQQKQQVEKAEARQDVELKNHSKKIRADQEREAKSFRESLKQELKLLKHEINLLPKENRKDAFKLKKDQLDQDQADREKHFYEKLNENHEVSVKRLNDAHREHIALKEKQFLEEKHQLMRSRENALWETEEKHLQDKHQLAKEQLKDVYFLQRHQMLIRHNKELEQVRRMNHQKEETLLKRQAAEKRQLPKRIRQEMKTREKMFREKIRISMVSLISQDDEKEQLKRFQEQEKIKYDAEKQRCERKHRKQLEELRAATEYSIKELEVLQNEKAKMLMEHENSKLKSLDEEYQKELKCWKSNLMPRKQKLEDSFERQLSEQERFYGEYLHKGLSTTPSLSVSSLASSSTSSAVF